MRKKSKSKWTPPPRFTAAVKPEEFKFCCGLMEAAYSGHMATPNPAKQGVNIEGVGRVSLTDIPMNRAMLSVREHFGETRGDGPSDEFLAMAFRLSCFADLVRDSLAQKDPQSEPFIRRNGEVIEVEDALFEAAAVVKIGPDGFVAADVFAEAKRLQEEADHA